MKNYISILTLALVGAGSLASGATILDVSGPSPFGFAGAIPVAYMTGWTQTSTFTDVSIVMPLKDGTTGGPIGGTEGTVYLMNSVGTGTTAANEVAAPVTISGMSGAFGNRTLFSGLTLGPGSYYLVLSPAKVTGSSQSLSPEGSSTPVAVLGAGVSHVSSYGVSLSPAVYAPASDFGVNGVESSPSNFFVTITGNTGSAPSGVPEPGTVSLLGGGLAVMALVLRRRSAAGESKE